MSDLVHLVDLADLADLGVDFVDLGVDLVVLLDLGADLVAGLVELVDFGVDLADLGADLGSDFVRKGIFRKGDPAYGACHRLGGAGATFFSALAKRCPTKGA